MSRTFDEIAKKLAMKKAGSGKIKTEKKGSTLAGSASGAKSRPVSAKPKVQAKPARSTSAAAARPMAAPGPATAGSATTTKSPAVARPATAARSEAVAPRVTAPGPAAAGSATVARSAVARQTAIGLAGARRLVATKRATATSAVTGSSAAAARPSAAASLVPAVARPATASSAVADSSAVASVSPETAIQATVSRPASASPASFSASSLRAVAKQSRKYSQKLDCVVTAGNDGSDKSAAPAKKQPLKKEPSKTGSKAVHSHLVASRVVKPAGLKKKSGKYAHELEQQNAIAREKLFLSRKDWENISEEDVALLKAKIMSIDPSTHPSNRDNLINRSILQYNLARIYFDGTKTIKGDLSESFKLCTLSAEANLPAAQDFLGSIYVDNKESTDLHFKLTGKALKDESERIELALYWHKKAAEAGNILSMASLAELYEKGTYVFRKGDKICPPDSPEVKDSITILFSKIASVSSVPDTMPQHQRVVAIAQYDLYERYHRACKTLNNMEVRKYQFSWLERILFKEKGKDLNWAFKKAARDLYAAIQHCMSRRDPYLTDRHPIYFYEGVYVDRNSIDKLYAEYLLRLSAENGNEHSQTVRFGRLLFRNWPHTYDSKSYYGNTQVTVHEHPYKTIESVEQEIYDLLISYSKFGTNPQVHLWLGHTYYLEYQNKKKSKQKIDEIKPILELAIKEYQKASDLGNIRALCQLGFCQEEMLEVSTESKKNKFEKEAEIYSLYLQAAKADLPLAYHRAAMLLKKEIDRTALKLQQMGSHEKKEAVELQSKMASRKKEYCNLLDSALKADENNALLNSQIFQNRGQLRLYTDIHLGDTYYYLAEFCIEEKRYAENYHYISEIFRWLDMAERKGYKKTKAKKDEFMLILAEYYLQKQDNKSARHYLKPLYDEHNLDARVLYAESYKRMPGHLSQYLDRSSYDNYPVFLNLDYDKLYVSTAVKGDLYSQRVLLNFYFHLGRYYLDILEKTYGIKSFATFLNDLEYTKIDQYQDFFEHDVKVRIPSEYSPHQLRNVKLYNSVMEYNESLADFLHRLFSCLSRVLYWWKVLESRGHHFSDNINESNSILQPLIMQKNRKKILLKHILSRNLKRHFSDFSFSLSSSPYCDRSYSSEKYRSIFGAINRLCSHNDRYDISFSCFYPEETRAILQELLDDYKKYLTVLLCEFRHRGLPGTKVYNSNPALLFLANKDLVGKLFEYVLGKNFKFVSKYDGVQLSHNKQKFLDGELSKKQAKDEKHAKLDSEDFKKLKEFNGDPDCAISGIPVSLKPFNYLYDKNNEIISNENPEYDVMYENLEEVKETLKMAALREHIGAQYEYAKLLHHQAIISMVGYFKYDIEVSEFVKALNWQKFECVLTDQAKLLLVDPVHSVVTPKGSHDVDISFDFRAQMQKLKVAYIYYQFAHLAGLPVQDWVIPSLSKILNPMWKAILEMEDHSFQPTKQLIFSKLLSIWRKLKSMTGKQQSSPLATSILQQAKENLENQARDVVNGFIGTIHQDLKNTFMLTHTNVSQESYARFLSLNFLKEIECCYTFALCLQQARNQKYKNINVLLNHFANSCGKGVENIIYEFILGNKFLKIAGSSKQKQEQEVKQDQEEKQKKEQETKQKQEQETKQEQEVKQKQEQKEQQKQEAKPQNAFLPLYSSEEHPLRLMLADPASSHSKPTKTKEGLSL